jgi:hypothetical protein
MIDSAFLIALAVSLLKLGEIVLRPHQRKFLQDVADELAIRLDDASKSYRRTPAILRAVRAWHLYVAAIAGLIVSVPAIELSQGFWSAFAMVGVLASVYWVAVAASWRRVGAVFNWIGIDQPSRKMIFRLIAALGGMIFLLGVNLIPSSVLDDDPALVQLIIMIDFLIICIILFAPAIYRQILFFSNVIAPLALAVTLLLCLWTAGAVVLRGIVGMTWRIAEHSGGAWAALLYLATGILGVAAVLGHWQHSM